MKKIILATVVAACIILVAVAYRQKQAGENNLGPAEFRQAIERQSELKRFADADELLAFFADRSKDSSGLSYRTTEMGVADSAAPQTAPGLPEGGGGDGIFSSTNVQVLGVDEADIIKTDGDFIYAVTDLSLVIIKAERENEPAAIVASRELSGRPQGLYVTGDQLVIHGASEDVQPFMDRLIYRPSRAFIAMYDITDRANPVETRRLDFEGSYVASRLVDRHLYFITATYNFYPLSDAVVPAVREGDAVISAPETTDRYIYPDVYYIDAGSEYNATTVAAFDLDNVQAPLQSQVYMMPAGETVYASSNALYLAYTTYVNYYQIQVRHVRELLAGRFDSRERSRLDEIEAIDPLILSEDEKTGKVMQVIEAYLRRLPQAERAVLEKELNDELIRYYEDADLEFEQTVIHKIAMNGTTLTHAATGRIPGRLLNQFSLDEYEGFLRVATTRNQDWFTPLFFSDYGSLGVGRVGVEGSAASPSAPTVGEAVPDTLPADIAVDAAPEKPVSDVAPDAAGSGIMPSEPISIPRPLPQSDSDNNIYVLDGNLAIVGSIENLALGERIYSARFMGDRGYLVTFKQVDPLFALDLSDPAAPMVAGQLKIPGFSSYLHPYDETMVIGVGRTVVDNGDQGVDVQGLKLSLFDVSDLAAPREVAAVSLGGRGSDSPVLFDHKAFLLAAEHGMFTVPVTLTPPTSTDYQPDFQGVIVYALSRDSLTERGRIRHRLPSEMMVGSTYRDDTARRALYSGDYLYSFSASTLTVSRLSDIGLVRSLELPFTEQVYSIDVRPMEGAAR